MVLHKSPLRLAACCGRFYNSLLRQWWGLFHYLRRLQCPWKRKRPASIWESSRSYWREVTFSFCLLSCFTCHINQFYVLSIFPATLYFPILPFYPPPPLWLSFLCYLTHFPFSYFSLSNWRASWCITSCAAAQSGSSPLTVFMWQRPDLLKAGALTKKGTNDRERCQSNTQAFQRCKQMCVCTKGAL